MYMYVLTACMCIMYAFDAYGNQKMMSFSLTQAYWLVLSYHVDVVNLT